jgi:hypothetical protein
MKQNRRSQPAIFSLVTQHFDAAALEVTALNAVGDERESFVIRG